MSASHAKSGFGFWAIAALAITLLYPLSFGPACWASQRAEGKGTLISAVYQPMLQLAHRGPDVLSSPVLRYAQWGMQPGYYSILSENADSGYVQWESATGFGCLF